MPRRFRLTVILVVATMAATACGSAATSPGASSQASAPASTAPASQPAEASEAAPASPASPNAGGTLVVAMPGDIAATDPILTGDTNSDYLTRNVAQGLVDYAPGSTTEIVGLLATSWVVSPDGLTYTFTLRPDVTFQDGTPFDATAVKSNFDRWINLPQQLQGAASSNFGYIEGFGSACVIASVSAPDPHTVVFTLRHPQSSFLSVLTFAGYSILSPAALKAGGGDNSVTDASKMTEAQGGKGALVGTGPFKFVEWVPGDHITIARSDSYWGPKANLDQVVFKPVADQAQVLNGLKTGEFDLAQQVSPQYFDAVKANPALQLIDRGGSCNYMAVQFNLQYPTVDNVKIREAIAYAVNKQPYIDAFYGGLATPADSWMPLTIQNAVPLGLPTYDPEKAKQLIAESGIPNPTLDFWYMTQARPYVPDPKGLFQAISADLQAVGFKVVPHTEAWSNYVNDALGGKLPMYLLGGTCSYPGPDEFLTARFGYVSGKPALQFSLKDDALNTALVQAGQATDEAKAKALWQKAQELIKADMPSVPLLNSRPPAAAQAYVKDWVPQAALNEPFGTVWLSKRP